MRSPGDSRFTLDPGRLVAEFDHAAATYDRLTDLNPGYERHLEWSARRLGLTPGARVLDLCCGTGKSTEALAAVCPDARIIGMDSSSGMIAEARRRRARTGVPFIEGDAMNPRAAGVEGPFDAVLMAYGIRNVADPDVCLSRLYALLRPGGRLCLHEYALGTSLRSMLLWNAVSLGIIVPAGKLLSGSSRLYRYLWRSVLAFDTPDELAGRMHRAGFADVRFEAMDGWQRGILHSFVGVRPT